MSIVKVTRNSQITIPKEIRKKVGIKEGDRVEITVEGNRVLIRKIEMEDITDFLPRNFEETIAKTKKDSRDRLRELGVVL
jgi:AbrB family looped-hinge helix DNA binding protein